MQGSILGLLHLWPLSMSRSDTHHYHSSVRVPPCSTVGFTVLSILVFLFQSKLFNQISERNLSAGYLYAAPRQKCRFKETAICKHDGSSWCTIKGNLKERGKVIEGQNESKVENFVVLLQTQK